MPKLSDFFQPLNLLSVFYFLLLFAFFDIFGTFIKSLFVKNKNIDGQTRIGNWLIGLSMFVAIWFLLGFFVEPNRPNLLVSTGILLAISLPYYIKSKQIVKLVRQLKSLVLPILLFVPFLPSVFVKASLPPYYSDEMAYHFISPYALLHQLSDLWVFNGGVLTNAPRLMDTFYVLGFSLTRTYSVVRLVQFLVLVTTVLFVYLLIKKIFGWLPSALFVLIFLSMPLSLPFTATIGYVDVPAYCFMLLGLTLGLAFLVKKSDEYLFLSMAFWGMSIGTKYPSLIAFGIFVILFVSAYLFKYRNFKKIFNKKVIFTCTTLLLVLGGYWYIKNFVVYGNPIYPFFFHCWGKYAGDCANGSNFFGTWTMKINRGTILPILKELLPGSKILLYALVISPTLVFLSKNKDKIFAMFLVVAFFGIEIIVLKYSSGFDIRYYQHMQFLLLFLIILAADVRFKSELLRFIQFIFVSALVVVCLVMYVRNAKYMNSLNFINWNEINYALGRSSIYDWVKQRIPDMADATIWCEDPPNGPVALARFDPDMIWYADAGFIRSYLLNCYWDNPSVSPSQWGDFQTIAKDKKLVFWTVTPNKCLRSDKVVSGGEAKDSNENQNEIKNLLLMRKLNNAIICNSKEVLPNLYYLDYKNIK